MLGCPHHCLAKHILYDEQTAFPTPPDQSAPAAA
jgi:hypothetical protein